jgi:hypothetical protein
LHQDVAALSPYRLANADLASVLGNRYQHDVHNPDAPHKKGNSGNAPQKDGDYSDYLGCHLEDILSYIPPNPDEPEIPMTKSQYPNNNQTPITKLLWAFLNNPGK